MLLILVILGDDPFLAAVAYFGDLHWGSLIGMVLRFTTTAAAVTVAAAAALANAAAALANAAVAAAYSGDLHW